MQPSALLFENEREPGGLFPLQLRHGVLTHAHQGILENLLDGGTAKSDARGVEAVQVGLSELLHVLSDASDAFSGALQGIREDENDALFGVKLRDGREDLIVVMTHPATDGSFDLSETDRITTLQRLNARLHGMKDAEDQLDITSGDKPSDTTAVSEELAAMRILITMLQGGDLSQEFSSEPR